MVVLPCETSARQEYRSVQSSSHRYLVHGNNAIQLVNAARWAEKVTTRIEKEVGRETLSPRRAALRIIIYPADGKNESGVRISQGFDDGLLVQHLFVRDYRNADWEDALESLTLLLLNRHAVSYQSVGTTSTAAVVPTWLAVGLAQNIDPSLRSRNRQLVVGWDDTDGVPDIATVLTRDEWPRGRCRDKAVAGEIVAMLLAGSRTDRRFDRIFKHCAADRQMTVAWIAANLFDAGSPEALEESWRLWVARERTVVAAPAEPSVDQVELLRECLKVHAGSNNVPVRDDIPAEMSLADLIPIMNERWIPDYCRIKTRELDRLAFGLNEDFADVTAAYTKFFAALRRRRAKHVVASRLERAEKTLADLATTLEARKVYMDRMEKVHGRRPPGPSTARRQATNAVRSELRKYVDDIEQRLDNRQDE